MIRFLVIAALLFTAFVLGIIVARDDLREDAIKQARTAIKNAPTGTQKPDKEARDARPGWTGYFSGSDNSTSTSGNESPNDVPPPRSLPPIEAPTDYGMESPEQRLPVSPAERAQIEEGERTGKSVGNPDRLRRIEERKAERERLLAMSPEDRKAYREQKRQEKQARRAERQARREQNRKPPASIEDVLQDNP